VKGSEEDIVQIYKFAAGLSFAAVTLTAVVLLAVFGNADMAILVAVAAGLVGMYVLRHHARAQLIYDARPPSAGDPTYANSGAGDRRRRPGGAAE
jgi:fatty acid desaturase